MSAVVGVDVGGTKISAARWSAGQLSTPDLTETDVSGADVLFEEIIRGVDAVRDGEIDAVGVGLPGPIEFKTGRVRTAVNLPLEDIPVREVLHEKLGIPVYVDNDATVAALAEAWGGDRIAVPNLVMFTVGTGVGGGLVLRGRVYRGATGAAAELGMTMIGADLDAGTPEAGEFPQPGSLESLASGTALDGLALAAARDEPKSVLGRRLAEEGEVSGHDVVGAAKQGDEHALRVITVLGERLGIGIANAINTFDPDVVAIGGGVSSAGELLLAPARETARKFTLTGVGTETEIRIARLGPEAGVLGAALLAHTELASERENPVAQGGS